MRTRPRGSGTSSAVEGNATIGNLACQSITNMWFINQKRINRKNDPKIFSAMVFQCLHYFFIVSVSFDSFSENTNLIALCKAFMLGLIIGQKSSFIVLIICTTAS